MKEVININKKVSIITPAYNRGELLKNCYISLKKQTNKSFEWIIVDDGSTDDTKAIVDSFIKDDILNIVYIYKQNGGKHTAWNIGVSHASGDVTFILDSDDILTEDAVETILNKFDEYREYKDLCSITFLRMDKSMKIIGDLFPKDEFNSSHIECALKLGISGDRSEVFVTEILKQYKFPEIKGEKFLGEDIVLIRMGKKYRTIYINKPIYIAEYLDGGLTKLGRKLRINCPIGGMIRSKEFIDLEDIPIKLKFKHMLLYICYGIFANKSIVEMGKEVKSKSLFYISILPGFLLNRYWKYKYN